MVTTLMSVTLILLSSAVTQLPTHPLGDSVVPSLPAHKQYVILSSIGVSVGCMHLMCAAPHIRNPNHPWSNTNVNVLVWLVHHVYSGLDLHC